ALRNVYSTFDLSVDDTGTINFFYVCSDDTVAFHGKLKLTIMDFSGHVAWSDSARVTIEAGQSLRCYGITREELLTGVNPSRTFLKMELDSGDKKVAGSEYYFVKPKALLLDKPAIHKQLSQQKDGTYALTLVSSTLAKNVFIDVPDGDVRYSDNF